MIKSLSILLVEDEAIIAMNEESALKKEGYTVMTVYNGADAIHKVEDPANAIDLILMDIDLGSGMDGVEAAKEILKIRDIPVVFLSSHSEKEIVTKTEQVSSYGYVLKNLDMTILAASIRMALRLHETRKELSGKSLEAQRAVMELEAGNEEMAATNEELNAINEELEKTLAELMDSQQLLLMRERELEESRTRLREQYDKNPVPTYSWRRSGDDFILADMNLAAKKVYENIAGAYVGQSAGGLYRNKPEIITNLERCYSGCDLFSEEIRSEHFLPGRYAKITYAFVPPDTVNVYLEDINDRYMMMKNLRENEAQLKTITDNAPDTILQVAPGGIITYVNRLMPGLAYEEVIGSDVFRWVPEGQHRILMNALDAVFQTGTTSEYVSEGPGPDGENRIYNVRVSPVIVDDRTISAIYFATDISGRINAETSLRQTQELFKSIVDNTNSLIYVKDVSGKFLLVNKSFENLLGLPGDGIIGKTTHDLFSRDSADDHRRNDLEVIELKAPIRKEEINDERDGRHTYISSKFPLYDLNGDIYAVCGISTDITDRKRSESEIMKLLEEKEIILREVHHRIKNNITQIYSFLSLQMERQDDPGLRLAFTDAMNRVQGMRVLYNRLYLRDIPDRMSLRSFIEELLCNIIEIYPAAIPITCECSIVEMECTAVLLSSLGIIINELATNAMKHAFPAKDRGRISVSAIKNNGKIHLVFSDDGIGLSDDALSDKHSGFGLHLVRMLVMQINGTYTIEVKAGTRFSLEFMA